MVTFADGVAVRESASHVAIGGLPTAI